MSVVRAASVAAVAIGIVAGSVHDDVRPREPRREGGFVVLAADLHVHSFFGDGGMPPWELSREAQRRGLDVIVVTNHNQLTGARLAAARDRQPGEPIVIVGQEITAPRFHIAAAGLSQTVNWRLPARDAIRAVQAQGGVAIAAHPVTDSWRPDDPEALELLDGAEVAHPLSLPYPLAATELLTFYRTATKMNVSLAPIGSSDFHFGGTLGQCRTFIFAQEVSETSVFDAIRAGRTVALGARGELTGDPSLVAVVRDLIARDPPVTGVDPTARALSWLVLAALVVLLMSR